MNYCVPPLTSDRQPFSLSILFMACSIKFDHKNPANNKFFIAPFGRLHFYETDLYSQIIATYGFNYGDKYWDLSKEFLYNASSFSSYQVLLLNLSILIDMGYSNIYKIQLSDLELALLNVLRASLKSLVDTFGMRITYDKIEQFILTSFDSYPQQQQQQQQAAQAAQQQQQQHVSPQAAS